MRVLQQQLSKELGMLSLTYPNYSSIQSLFFVDETFRDQSINRFRHNGGRPIDPLSEFGNRTGRPTDLTQDLPVGSRKLVRLRYFLHDVSISRNSLYRFFV